VLWLLFGLLLWVILPEPPNPVVADHFLLLDVGIYYRELRGFIAFSGEQSSPLRFSTSRQVGRRIQTHPELRVASRHGYVLGRRFSLPLFEDPIGHIFGGLLKGRAYHLCVASV
jgi:hypothetical protein